MARRVPMCRAISKASASVYHPSSHEVRYRCAVLLMGTNSVIPWTAARTITCKIGIRYQRSREKGKGDRRILENASVPFTSPLPPLLYNEEEGIYVPKNRNHGGDYDGRSEEHTSEL